MKPSFELNNKDLAAFLGCSVRTASKRKQEIIRNNGIEDNRKLTLYDISVYLKVPFENIMDYVSK